jgi:lysophospholipase L1-like esterase
MSPNVKLNRLRVLSQVRPASSPGWRTRGASHLAALVVVSSLAACGGSSPTSPTTFSLSCPASFETTSSNGQPMVVSYPPPLPIGGTPPVTTTCTPVSGAVFPVKATTVQCVATDKAQHTAACSFTITVVPPPYLKYTRHLAFGDSLTEGQDGLPSATTASRYVPLVVRPEIAYPTRLQERFTALYTAQTTQVINRGKGGEKAVEGATRLPGEITTYRPEVVLLLEGANDIFGGNTSGVASAAVALRAMVRETRARGLPVYLATLPPENPAGSRGGGYALVVPLNTEIQRIATEEGAVLVDIYTAFNGDLTLIGPDGLHPNEAGYLRMAETFLAKIRATLEIPFPGTAALPMWEPEARVP